MKDLNKKAELQRNKHLATGILILMAVVFIATTILLKKGYSGFWIGGIRAFSEAAMVGALADWFAVTALFHHPLGLKIPHTNLIESSKSKIGDNLGNFVVDNFLAPNNIRPYIQKIKVANKVGEWLYHTKNQDFLIKETSAILLNILTKIDDQTAVNFIQNKVREIADNMEMHTLAGNTLEYIIQKNEHQQIITYLSSEGKFFVSKNQDMIRDRVSENSYFFIPKSVDNKIADKVASGLLDFFSEVEKDANHPLRKEITQKLENFAQDLKTKERWKNELQVLKKEFLNDEKIKNYAVDIWEIIKQNILKELQTEESSLKTYLKKNLNELALNLQADEILQNKIDHWVRITAYKHILKNTHQFGEMISSTVGNWDGKELSQKLELEVGKDLQYIRISGTIVGGTVGFLIYIMVHFLS